MQWGEGGIMDFLCNCDLSLEGKGKVRAGIRYLGIKDMQTIMKPKILQRTGFES